MSTRGNSSARNKTDAYRAGKARNRDRRRARLRAEREAAKLAADPQRAEAKRARAQLAAAKRETAKAAGYHGPLLPPLMLSRSGHLVCTRAHSHNTIARALNLASAKRVYTFLQVLRVCSGGYYYLCPHEGEHWHRSRHDRPGSFPVPVRPRLHK